MTMRLHQDPGGEGHTLAHIAPPSGSGEMGRLVREKDWAETPLGAMRSWPQSLRTVVSICLASRFPQLIWWGPERIQIYNDAYRPVLGAKHPESLGQPGSECWKEIWHVVGPLYDHVRTSGESTWNEDLVLLMNRYGYTEETYFTFSYSPIQDETDAIGGVLVTCVETTGQVLGARRLHTLRELGALAVDVYSEQRVCDVAAEVLGRNQEDVPFALLYVLSSDGARADLAATVGLTPGHEASPASIDLVGDLDAQQGWPLRQVVRTRTTTIVENLSERFGPLPGGPWSEAPTQALILPIQDQRRDRPYGVLIGGVSPTRYLDDDYRGFYDLVAQALATVIGGARAYAEERRRAEALAEIDRAKTTFFSNVSHEFRTPLTLQMAPLEEVLADESLAQPHQAALRMVHRNTLRLLKLVNTLLDFSRIEAGRADASFEPTDLAVYTAELASWFRSAMEKAGLEFVVDCPSLDAPVYVDREHWEKIVLNLLSNALKFTFEGRVAVRLRQADGHVTLTVEDTGVGVPEEELPRLFERFHRIRSTEGRTHEGTGIGLALVRELVRMHGGEIDVTSRVEQGTTFAISIPLGKAHLPPEHIGQPRRLASTALGAAPYVEEALRWLPDAETAEATPADGIVEETPPRVASADPDTEGAVDGARILLADDNADMRAYLSRLLGERFVVETATDGRAALEAARRRRPDLILSDVMMPHLDGFGLLAALRGEEALREIPVILLSARAGEESRVEGLEVGADDYLTKPFSSRELLARIEGQIKLARLRRTTAERLEQLYAAERRAVRARDELMAVVSHDLRSPLSTITMALRLLARGTAGESEQRSVNVIRHAVQDMERLISDLLDVRRIESGSLQLSLRAERPKVLINEAAEVLRLLTEEHGLDLKWNIAPDTPPVRADRGRIEQVFQNLVGNAVKFTAQGSITLAAEQQGDAVRFAVRDTGTGIEPERLPHLFDRYWQAERRSNGGLGLGLAIVKGIVEAHGGCVWAESTVGEGSIFYFTLPVADAAP